MTSPKVSILIPVYNRQQFIGECIQSALDQTFSDFEVVVVDNASTDKTWDICQSYALKDKRVKIFENKQNIGPVLNWQRCFNEAKGIYGKILFSDDLMSPSYLEKTVSFLKDNQVAFVFSSVEIGSSPGRGKNVYHWQHKSGQYPSEMFVEASLFSGDVPVSPGAALFRMCDLRENLKLEIPTSPVNDFLEHGAGIDLLLYLLAASKYPMVGYIVEPVSFFRHHGGSITISSSGGTLSARYRDAKLWFAAQCVNSNFGWLQNKSLFKTFIACEWLRECYIEKRIIILVRYLSKFNVSTENVKLNNICSAILYIFERILRRGCRIAVRLIKLRSK